MIRSALYVPGDQADKLAKAFARGADAVIVDLEDAVRQDSKAAARTQVSNWLGGLVDAPAEVWVRVNPGEEMLTDLQALGGHRSVTGFVLAKADGSAVVAEAAHALDELGSPAALSPLLESAAAILDVHEVARAPRVRFLQVGEVDLCADIGMTPSADGLELLAIRTSVVLASAAAGIQSPLGPVSTDFRDVELMRSSTDSLRRLGYVGRACIHPAQVAVANAVYTPTAEEVQRAAGLVARFSAADGGVALDEDGRMIDLAVIRRAEQLLALVR